MMTVADTLLMLDGMGVPLYSARGLTQVFTQIAASADVDRTVNGVAVDMSYEGFRKWGTKISCTDQRSPKCDNIWPGQIVTIHSVAEFSYLTATESPSHEMVTGSDYEEGDYTFYRPVIRMMLTAPLNITRDEYGATVSWDATFEEVGE